MNPLTNMKNVIKLSEQELYTNNKTSWHDQYRDSAWVFIGGLPFDLTEGDIICIFSQYGEIVNINLIRDKESGKSKGFCFLCYEDQRSTILAVDNLNGIKILNRAIRVDHVSNYKIPKQGKKTDAETKKLYEEGCAPKPLPIQPIKGPIKTDPDDFRETLADQISSEIKLPQRLPIYPIKQEKLTDDESEVAVKKEKKEKKPKKDKKKKKKKKKSKRPSDSESDASDVEKPKKKKKKKKKTKDSSSAEESDEDSEGDKMDKRKRSSSPHERKKSRR